MPQDHFLRKVENAVDFSFINKLCAPLYCADNGRPAIEPEVLFRMLLVGYLYGIKSEKRLEEEINYNIAYLSLIHIYSGPGEGLLFFGNVIIPFVDHFPKDTSLYQIMTTRPEEVAEAGT